MSTSFNSDLTALTFTTALEARTEDTNICGLPCPGSCQTCVQSNADLNVFYGINDPAAATVAAATTVAVAAEPIEVVVMAPAGDEELDEQVRNARTRDEIEAANRNGEWADEGEYDGDCDCLECRTGHNPDLWFDDRQDDYYDDRETGLDWNEGGYFD